MIVGTSNASRGNRPSVPKRVSGEGAIALPEWQTTGGTTAKGTAMRRWLAIVTALAAVLVPHLAHARQASLPGPEFLGKGWEVVAPAANDNEWQTYGGTDGSRVMILNATYAPTDVAAMRNDWVVFTGDLSTKAFWNLAQLTEDKTTPLAGCGSAYRLFGWDALYLAYPVGLTVCADDENHRILAVRVSGTVLDETGTAASDAIVTRLLALPPAAATPEP